MKGGWRKLHDGELHNFYPSLTLDFLSKKDYVEWVCGTNGGKRKNHKRFDSEV